MGLFSKLLGKTDRHDTVVEAPPCPHTALVPRWDSIDDIGIEDKATHFVCEACEQSFSPEEARRLRQSAADRLAGITSEN